MERRLVLHFPRKLVNKPVISMLVRDFDLEFNILKANVTEEEGNLVLELTGAGGNLDRAVKHLKELGVKVQSLSQQVEMRRDRCTDCTACVPLCPTGALEVRDYRVAFESEKCIACGACIRACPVKAMVLNV